MSTSDLTSPRSLPGAKQDHNSIQNQSSTKVESMKKCLASTCTGPIWNDQESQLPTCSPIRVRPGWNNVKDTRGWTLKPCPARFWQFVAVDMGRTAMAERHLLVDIKLRVPHCRSRWTPADVPSPNAVCPFRTEVDTLLTGSGFNACATGASANDCQEACAIKSGLKHVRMRRDRAR